MNKVDGVRLLYALKREVSSAINAKLLVGKKKSSPIRSLFLKDFTDVIKEREGEADLLKRCSRLDREAREQCLELIFQILITKGLNVVEVDAILSQYFINYYSNPKDLTSSTNTLGLSKLRLILMPIESDLEDKLRKLAQVVYQELYGLSVLDEIFYMDIDQANGSKIEEVATVGPNGCWFNCSGIPTKLDKIHVPENVLRNVVDRLSINSPLLLNKSNPSVTTDSIARDRISLTCPEYTRYYDLNIRRHYPGFINRDFLIKIQSSTEEFERFCDLIMDFYPRIILTGDQAAGKTTRLRLLAERYPANTVIGTIESSYELELGNLPHLIVKQLRVNNTDPEKAMRDCLRFGLHVMINGETRNALEAATVLQVGERSSKGTLTSSHAPNAWDCIRSYVQMLVKERIFTSEAAALSYLSHCIDFIIVPAVDNVGDNATGFRYISAVYEIPRVKESEVDSFEPRILFEADKQDFILKKVNNISDEMLDFLSSRNYKPESLAKLRSGIYV